MSASGSTVQFSDLLHSFVESRGADEFGDAIAASDHYLSHHQQFQLHSLLTEQRHRKTWNLEREANSNAEVALKSLFSVDEDITAMLKQLTSESSVSSALPDSAESDSKTCHGFANLVRLCRSIERLLLNQRRLYVYGCGATGRLAKQMESTFWRPFWARLERDFPQTWTKVAARLGSDVRAHCIGEMTGADRALISSLEGFEDLQLIGQLQLEQHGIRRGDTVVCVTEGGETSSVIGTILAAHRQWESESPSEASSSSTDHLFFIYNNPDSVLRPFHRSRSVIEHGGISKINLSTGPQAITGSTRMQATSSETFTVATCMHVGIWLALRQILTNEELVSIGFNAGASTDSDLTDDEVAEMLKRKLLDFEYIQNQVAGAAAEVARFTVAESSCYSEGARTTYLASALGLMTVFIDNTERSPTFRLLPLDTVNAESRQCWLQVWTAASDAASAWQSFLGRSFLGLPKEIYEQPFDTQIPDPYLRLAALNSLKNAGNEQQFLYDFSFAGKNVESRGPSHASDLGVAVFVSPEDIATFTNAQVEADGIFSPECVAAAEAARRFFALFPRSVALLVSDVSAAAHVRQFLADNQNADAANRIAAPSELVVVPVDRGDDDPLGIRQQIALKLVLNAHSTAVMCRCGRVCFNTMTNVSPSNLKLIGRATFLILSHVTAMISQSKLPVSVHYNDANRVLHLAIAYIRAEQETEKARVANGGVPNPNKHQIAEVALSIIFILETSTREQLSASSSPFTMADALATLQQHGSLSLYLQHFEASSLSS